MRRKNRSGRAGNAPPQPSSCSLPRYPLESLAGRRGSEAAVTRSTRNRVTGDELVRGFESHPLRHLETSRHPIKPEKPLNLNGLRAFLHPVPSDGDREHPGNHLGNSPVHVTLCGALKKMKNDPQPPKKQAGRPRKSSKESRNAHARYSFSIASLSSEKGQGGTLQCEIREPRVTFFCLPKELFNLCVATG